jgi:uncharacterized protein (TIGR03083 family)
MMLSVWEDLAEAWGVWAIAGESMTQAEWERPTRLPGWDVKALYAHASAWPVMFDRLAAAPDVGPAVWSDASSLLASFNQPGGLAESAAQQVADRARRDATTRSRETLVHNFASAGPQAIRKAIERGDAVIDYLGAGGIRLEDAGDIGLLEAVVHWLDLEAATGTAGEMAQRSLRRVAAVLSGIPDPAIFIEAATGRATKAVLPVLR